MEKQFKYQLDALKKTLTHVSSAAQGLDKQLDAALINLKELMRGAPGSKILEQMERVQKAATDYDHSRHGNARNVAKQFNGMIALLSELNFINLLLKSCKIGMIYSS